MATYKQIQDYIEGKHGFTVKSCWIAHMKEICGLSVKVSPRRYDENVRQKPCPESKKAAIEEAFQHFGMI